MWCAGLSPQLWSMEHCTTFNSGVTSMSSNAMHNACRSSIARTTSASCQAGSAASVLSGVQLSMHVANVHATHSFSLSACHETWWLPSLYRLRRQLLYVVPGCSCSTAAFT